MASAPLPQPACDIRGLILEIEPEKQLVMSWEAHWYKSVAKDRPSRVTYELAAEGPATTKLHLIHDDCDGQTATDTGSVDGWPLMMSSLKSPLDTGHSLTTS